MSETAEEIAGMVDAYLDGRCVICSWPLADSIEKGCVVGSCSMVDDHSAMAATYRRRRNLLMALQEILRTRMATPRNLRLCAQPAATDGS